MNQKQLHIWMYGVLFFDLVYLKRNLNVNSEDKFSDGSSVSGPNEVRKLEMSFSKIGV